MLVKIAVIMVSFAFTFAYAKDDKAAPLGCVINDLKAESYTLTQVPSLNGQFVFDRISLTLTKEKAGFMNGWALTAIRKSKDGAYVDYELNKEKQEVLDDTVSRYTSPINEENWIKATLAMNPLTGTRDIQILTIRQKIYNSPLDLLFPLNINHVSCRFF